MAEEKDPKAAENKATESKKEAPTAAKPAKKRLSERVAEGKGEVTLYSRRGHPLRHPDGEHVVGPQAAAFPEEFRTDGWLAMQLDARLIVVAGE